MSSIANIRSTIQRTLLLSFSTMRMGRIDEDLSYLKIITSRIDKYNIRAIQYTGDQWYVTQKHDMAKQLGTPRCWTSNEWTKHSSIWHKPKHSLAHHLPCTSRDTSRGNFTSSSCVWIRFWSQLIDVRSSEVTELLRGVWDTSPKRTWIRRFL